MTLVDFSEYALVLVNEDKVVFSSKKAGLRPLVECVSKFRRKLKGCLVYDKVTGMASAKLLIFSKICDKLRTNIISKPALDYLSDRKIRVSAEKTVDNILNKEMNSMCPMEQTALRLNEKDFYNHCMKIFGTGNKESS
jgi:hypothetical protein